jgi:ribA/ribD-fused uncharacterized protein
MTQEHNGIKYNFFWDGVFSNWHPSPFTIDDITFNCGEQYFMYHKALTFNDTETAELILKTDSPREQKKLGRSIQNYTDEAWAKVRYDVVKRGLREKYNQNPELKEYLLEHKDCQIVEASPYDRVWGIGYLSGDAIENIDNWGENLLGKMLTELANE